MFRFTSVLGLLLVLAACGTPQKNNLNTIASAPAGSGTVVVIDAPLPVATDAVIFGIEESGYEIKRADRPGPVTNRVLMVHGVTLTSWGEVGRAVLTPTSPATTSAEFFVRQRHDLEEWPNTELEELEGWEASIQKFLADVRVGAGVTDAMKVTQRDIAEVGADEQSGERAVIGFLSGGIFGAAIASDGVEEDIDIRTPYRYTMADKNGETAVVLSFSLLETGDCAAAYFGPENEAPTFEKDDVSIIYLVNRPSSDCAF
ncbi:hypothetical protein EOI86_05925 [Hwanghaeella grinnelliae]|uniref:Uncharacterized protein n=1 Tax=Hwanghaeella grinnelliae TaxID=2500179 RepID=A0A3S2VPT5_9PROT|nr:hypothetical protein [Hwanghaeella grinnelliae]RVU38805.1 hypothetical protein EOI86_05925 [Hwanghaeella grinnelliae]